MDSLKKNKDFINEITQILDEHDVEILLNA
jgi:hypothetical protein